MTTLFTVAKYEVYCLHGNHNQIVSSGHKNDAEYHFQLALTKQENFKHIKST